MANDGMLMAWETNLRNAAQSADVPYVCIGV